MVGQKMKIAILLVIFFGRVSCDWVSLLEEAVKDVGKTPSPCQKAMIQMLGNLVPPKLDDLWALKMIDSASKFPSGILSGNLGNIGNFKECINTVSKDGSIKGKYCSKTGVADTLNQKITNSTFNQLRLVEAAQPLLQQKKAGLGFPIAVCLPHQCSTEEINKMIKISEWSAFDCITKEEIEEKPLTTGAIVFIVIASLIGLLMVASTLYDLFCYHMDKKPIPLLLAYSVYSNGKKLLETKPSELSCVNGIKFFSMVWVVYGHTFCALCLSPLVNFFDAIAYIDTLKGMIVHAGVFAVDTFFCLSGLLLTYTFMKGVNKSNKFNLVTFYLHRYLRLTPALIILIFSTATIFEFMGSGPHWGIGVQYWTNACKKHWWSSLLYIQNYVHVDSMCLTHTWYLSVDTQLYLLSPIILVPLWKYPKYGIGILTAAIIASFITLFVFVYQYEVPALMISPLMLQKMTDFTQKYYFKTHTRATPYLIGMCAGYILYKMKYTDRTVPKFPKIVIVSLWGAFMGIMLGLVFAGHDTLMGFEYKTFDNVMYLMFVRPVWAVCICWVILACTCGYGGIINSFLSHPALQVLSRFSYSLYLVHLNVILLKTFSTKNGVYFDDINLQYEFWGHFGLSTILAVVWVLAFESPIIVMEKYILGR